MFRFLLLIIPTLLGYVEGTQRDGVTLYAGIPYAKAPIEDRAFSAPQPIAPWSDTLIAKNGECNCIQQKNAYSATNQSEDCLYLNIFVPEHKEGEKLPVMVWLHGGAFATGGTGKDDTHFLRHDMSKFASETGVVVVTVNYRLNVYGYLYLHGIDSTFEANLGLQDQLEALRFVHKNISAFGGDSTRITLCGQSAGAASVVALMSKQETDSLFARAIIMSPCIDHFLTEEDGVKRTRHYLAWLGLSPLSIRQMRTISHPRIAEANKRFTIQYGISGDIRCAFSPIIDGKTLKENPYVAARKCRKPILIGTTKDETRLFTNDIPSGLLPAFAYTIGMEVAKGDSSYMLRFTKAFTEKMFGAPIRTFISGYAGDVSTYHYSYLTPYMKEKKTGCFHSSEVPVVFGWDMPFCDHKDKETEQMGEQMRMVWKTFIYGETIEKHYEFK